MTDEKFIDYYEVLEVSPNANSGTLERMFRYLAQRYHPDNPETGDRLRFDAVLEAHNALKDPVERVQYDIRHKEHANRRYKLADAVNNGLGRDLEIQDKLLSVLYVKRRQNVRDPGIGDYELQLLLDCPPEHLEFHVWYLKEKGFVRRGENGMLTITAEGVDRANSEEYRATMQKLLTDRARGNSGAHDG